MLRMLYDDAAPEGAERWTVEWFTAIREAESDECIDHTSQRRTFSTPVAARRWARNALRRGVFADFGAAMIRHEVATQDDDAPIGIGIWIARDGETEEVS